VTPGGLPPGVVGARFDAPPGRDEPKPPQTRKTERWLEGYRSCAALGRDLGPGRVVCVMDREGDAFEVFETQQAHAGVDVLVRARGNRTVAAVDAYASTGPARSLDKTLRAAPTLGTMIVSIDRLTPRPKRSKRSARAGPGARRPVPHWWCAAKRWNSRPQARRIGASRRSGCRR